MPRTPEAELDFWRERRDAVWAFWRAPDLNRLLVDAALAVVMAELGKIKRRL